jgi:hypothetical protein
MSWRRHARTVMRFVTSKKTLMMLGTITFAFIGVVRHVAAQQAPPDLRMLLNLDLFSAPPPAASGAQPTAPSMLDQIRTLNSMGFLAGADTARGIEPGPTDTQPPDASEAMPSQSEATPGPSDATPGPSDAAPSQPSDSGEAPQL